MQEYKERVREYFSHKKGEGLILSPRNWMVVEKWEKMGIPLHVVIQGIDKTFDNLRSNGLRQRKVHHLGYCEPEILNLWREKRRQSGGPVTQSPQPENNAADNPAREQKRIREYREYIDRKISLLIRQVAPQKGKLEAGVRSAVEAGGRSAVCDIMQEPFGCGRGQEPGCQEHRGHESGVQEPVDSMPALLQGAVRAIRLEEELINLRQELRLSLRLDVESIEKRLQKLDGQLVQSLLVSLPSHKREALLSSAEQRTRSYKNQMESAAYQETIQAYLIELLRAELGIHKLSLYQ